MNSNTNRGTDTKQGKEEGMLEKIAHTIDPSGREISDDELIDPGANIKDDAPKRESTGQSTDRKPPNTH